jgi:hypothetical protein
VNSAHPWLALTLFLAAFYCLAVFGDCVQIPVYSAHPRLTLTLQFMLLFLIAFYCLALLVIAYKYQCH